jgi:hypothetical protein
MYVHVRQHPSVSWWVRRNEINTIPLVALAGVETEATISPWTAVAHRHPNLGDSVHSHTLPSLVSTRTYTLIMSEEPSLEIYYRPHPG